MREIHPNEIYLLERFLYEAIFQKENSEALSFDIIHTPEIKLYIDHFGSYKDDFCFVAEYKSNIIGAVWVRILSGDIKGFGNINNKTPEFAISILPEYRNKRVGTLLMSRMISLLKKQNYLQASLSVDKKNYALKMYQKLGFIILEEREYDYLMLLNLSSN